jgi:protease-4
MNVRAALRFLLFGLGALLLILAPLVAGWLVSRLLIPTPQVAVIRLQGDIWGSYTSYISQALEEAGNDRAVQAVVLEVSSPGGEVSASEGLYFDVLKLREIKPVVVSVNEMAASGAYYIASAADRIYSKPASMVGNIGVISVMPGPDVLDEVVVTTGPFKLSGGSQSLAVRQMEMMKQTFVAAILAQRSDRLTVGPEVLTRGEIWLGLEAQKMGLIDGIGSQLEAAAEAARLAGVRHFRIVDHTPEVPEDALLLGMKLERASTAATVAGVENSLPPGFYYRYVEPIP